MCCSQFTLICRHIVMLSCCTAGIRLVFYAFIMSFSQICSINLQFLIINKFPINTQTRQVSPLFHFSHLKVRWLTATSFLEDFQKAVVNKIGCFFFFLRPPIVTTQRTKNPVYTAGIGKRNVVVILSLFSNKGQVRRSIPLSCMMAQYKDTASSQLRLTQSLERGETANLALSKICLPAPLKRTNFISCLFNPFENSGVIMTHCGVTGSYVPEFLLLVFFFILLHAGSWLQIKHPDLRVVSLFSSKCAQEIN